MISIGDGDAKAASRREGRTGIGGDLLIDEVVGAAGVEEGDQLMVTNPHLELHDVTCADPGDGKERDLNIVLTVVKGVRDIVNGLDIEISHRN
jgi:hypothetical protein